MLTACFEVGNTLLTGLETAQHYDLEGCIFVKNPALSDADALPIVSTVKVKSFFYQQIGWDLIEPCKGA